MGMRYRHQQMAGTVVISADVGVSTDVQVVCRRGTNGKNMKENNASQDTEYLTNRPVNRSAYFGKRIHA